MGDSLPPPAEFDLVDSFARLRGDKAEIVLAEPKTELTESTAVVRLRRGGRSVDAAGDVVDSSTGRRLIVRVPRSELSDGIWSLTVVRSEDDVAPLAARLLVQGQRPLVLLWGANAGASAVPTSRASDPKRRAGAAAGQLLTRALSVLPDEQARRIRKPIRKIARRVLG
jgi:hypothetical protein